MPVQLSHAIVNVSNRTQINRGKPYTSTVPMDSTHVRRGRMSSALSVRSRPSIQRTLLHRIWPLSLGAADTAQVCEGTVMRHAITAGRRSHPS